MVQIDMPLPICCETCFAFDDTGDYPFCLISKEQMGYTFNADVCRMPHCPLKEENVVRCKDCKFWHDSIRCQMYSEGMETGGNWFCADGERRVKWNADD